MFQWGLTDTLSAIRTILRASLRFYDILHAVEFALLGLDSCIARSDQIALCLALDGDGHASRNGSDYN
jgi:hypothetical protein